MAHCQRHEVDNLHRLDHQQLSAKNLVSLGINHELHDAARVFQGLCARHGGDSSDRLGGNLDGVTGGERITLSQADGRERRVHVDGRGNRLAILRGAGTVTEQLREHHAVVIQRNVGELRTAVDVAERKNIRCCGAQVLVDSDCAVLGGFDARVLKPQPLGGGFAPGCDHHVIHFKVLGRALGVQVVHGYGVGVIGNGLYANARVSGNALVGDNLACCLGDIVIVTPEKRGSAFKQGYFGAVGGKNTGELDTNRTAADNAQAFRARGELLQLGRGEHALRFAGARDGRDSRHGTGVDDKTVGGDDQFVLARGDLNLGV